MVYPQYGGHTVRKDLNTTIRPRIATVDKSPVMIMFTNTLGKRIPEVMWQPNHFVPLLPLAPVVEVEDLTEWQNMAESELDSDVDPQPMLDSDVGPRPLLDADVGPERLVADEGSQPLLDADVDPQPLDANLSSRKS